MPARTMMDRPHQPGRNLQLPLSARLIQAARMLVAPVFDSERTLWQRCAPLLLMAAISTLPLIVVAAGPRLLFAVWLALIYLLSGYLWVEQARNRADLSHYWRAYLLAGIGLGALSLWLPAKAASALPGLLGLSAVVAIIVGVRLHSPSRPHAWYLLASALALVELGHLVAIFQTLRDTTPPVLTSLVSVAGLLLLPAALWTLLHRRIHGSSLLVMLDTAIVASGLALFTWVISIAPQIADPDARGLAQVIRIGWPLTALVGLVVAVRFLLTDWPTENPARQMTGAGLALLIVSIAVWSAIDRQHSLLNEHPGGNMLWLLAMVAFGAASLHPSMASLARPIHEQPSPLTWQRGLLLTLSVLMVPVALVLQAERGDEPTIVAIACFAAVLSALGAARLATIQRERTTLASHQNTIRLVTADLLTSQRYAAMVETVDDAAHAIAGPNVSTALYLSDGTPGEFVCPDVEIDGQRVSRVIRERDLTLTVRRAISIGTAAWLTPDEIASLRTPLGLADDTIVASIAPVGSERWLRGLLVTSGNRLTPEIARSQETLATLLALALDREERTADASRPAMHATASNGQSFTFVDVGSTEELDLADDGVEAVEDALRTAIESDDLLVRYQPRLDLVRGRIVAVEMLAAWESPLVGPGPRAALSAIADDEDLSRQLRQALLRLAARQIADWQRRYPGRDLEIVVPLGLAEVEAPGLFDDVGSILVQAGANPTRLMLQLSAATLLEASDNDLDALASLTAIGVQVTVSDAGAAATALASFSQIAINAFELESAVVNRLADDDRAVATSTRVIEHAHRVGAVVVAHGINDRDDWVRLRKLTCDVGQGTLFSPPVSPADLDLLLTRAQQRVAAS